MRSRLPHTFEKKPEAVEPELPAAVKKQLIKKDFNGVMSFDNGRKKILIGYCHLTTVDKMILRI